MTAIADQQLVGAHRSLARAEMPEMPQLEDPVSASGQGLFASAEQSGASNGALGGGSSGGFDVVEYLTGDKSHAGYRDDHGGSNYHEHLAFRTKEQRDAAMERLKAAGIQIGSVNDGRHAKGSYHYQDLAFDVPAAQVPVGKEQELSRRVRSILGMR